MINKYKIYIICLVIIVGIMGLSAFIKNYGPNNSIQENLIIISEKDVLLKKAQIFDYEEYNEETRNLNNDDFIKKEIFKEKVLVSEANKRGIAIEEEYKNDLKDLIIKKEIKEGDKEFIKSLSISENEFKEIVYNEFINLKLRSELRRELIKEIESNNISIGNKELQENVLKYNNEKELIEVDKRIAELEKVLDQYIDLITNNYIKVEKNDK